jgi:O-antigen biosynthesis protein
MQTVNRAGELLQHEPVSAPAAPIGRPQVRGKFLYAGDEKLYVHGVTYGTFCPGADGADFRSEAVERDFTDMANAGINAVRTYTVPPRWLLDAAQHHGLRVMVGLPWEQHIAFLDDPGRARAIEARVRADVLACAGHPAVLCYVIGNEIPAPIVRWHGHHRVERFLKRLYRTVKAEDPEGLVTYVNYPSTEYLSLPFLDFVAFNVYLESRDRLEAYLARLHNIAGDRPLVMSEIGLDSRQHGEEAQARILDWQVRSVFAAGCAGAFVFAWTDEWHRGGHDIADWDFGLTDRDRRPKPALASVRDAFAEIPFPPDLPWPQVSVVICSHNGARTIRDTLEGLRHLDYPDIEVIVIDDGSTDATAMIVDEYDVQLIRTENRGLSSARNTGLAAATGEIVAYIDDDARPDPHWIKYLAATYLRGDWVAVGGPNIAPAGDGPIADAVANAPGGPVHVLVTDAEADHIPGCNFAVRKEALEAIGGWDPRFRAAGDDVDCCWRLQEAGGRIGFSHAAMVWHHRRNSVKTYWKQQQGYGKAEALLEAKWPQRYNALGHFRWAGRMYGKGLAEAIRPHAGRIYQGSWGSAPFQSMYEPAPSLIASLPLMPEWWLFVVLLVDLSVLGLFWSPLLVAAPLLFTALAAPLVQAATSAAHASFPSEPTSRTKQLSLRLLTFALHLMQPVARLWGRLRFGLTPWRRRGWSGLSIPRAQSTAVWNEHWRPPEARLEAIESRLQEAGAITCRGGDFDSWDIHVRGGLFAGARVLMAIEEHGGGHQFVRFRLWPVWSALTVTVPTFLALAVAAWYAGSAVVGSVLLIGALLVVARVLQEGAGATQAIRAALPTAEQDDEDPA